MKTILPAIVLLVCIRLSSSADKYKDEPIYGCDGELFVDNSTASGLRERDWVEIHHDLDKIKIPKRFDAREQWPYCKSIKTLLYQGRCGGCWAFASGSVMSDRLCIATKGDFNQLLSIQDILECCTECVDEKNPLTIGGCKGGYIDLSFVFWQTKGVVTGGEKGCKSLSEGIREGTPIKECRHKCTKSKYSKSYENDKKFAIQTIKKPGSKKIDLRHIQAEIMLNGPVAAGMDSYYYIQRANEGDILKYDESQIDQEVVPRRHAIKIIGWDVIDGVPVWIMANTWGRNWCNKGFCHIRRGHNDFKIEVERQIIAGIAKFSDETLRMGGRKGESTSSSSRITVDVDVVHIFTLMYLLSIFTCISSIK